MPVRQFGTPREAKVFESDIKKPLFIDFSTTCTVRILSGEHFETVTHFINASKVTVLCLGEECPICANNKALIMQYPDTFRDEPKYSSKRIVNLVNVLDKSPVRVCECGLETRVSTGLGTCKCGKILTSDPVPSNKVRILSRGVTLFDQLDAINNAILDEKGERIGLTQYDITFVVSGTGKSKTITPIAGQPSEAPVVKEEDLFDLEKVTIKLNPAEMIDLQRGVSLKDLFAARRASEKIETVNADFLSKEAQLEVQNQVDELFKN